MKIAIVGTGIAGSAAAWLLSQDHDITLYERRDYAGGHCHTVEMDGHPLMDMGVSVYNEQMSPNLTKLLNHLSIESGQTDLPSFSVSLHDGGFEYSEAHPFIQRKNQINPAHLRTLKEISRFRAEAPAYLNGKKPNMSLGLYLKKHKYSKAFAATWLLPLGAAIWSVDLRDIAKFPAKSFIRFLQAYGFLSPDAAPAWKTIKGGSRTTIHTLLEPLQDRIKLDNAAVSIYRRSEGVEVTDKYGQTELYDQIILACHADQAFGLLRDRTEDETNILGAFTYRQAKAWLHQDKNLMPKTKNLWSGWNIVSPGGSAEAFVTHWINRLQPGIGSQADYFLSLNPPDEPQHALKDISYSHPVYTKDVVQAWPRIKHIQGADRTWFCGAWCGYGFHEDALSAGLSVAESIGPAVRPWSVTEKSPAGHYARPAKS